MSQKRILYGVFTGVAALIVCLIAVQLYWVNHAIQLKKAALDEKINRTLKQAVTYVEDQAMHFNLYGHSYIQPGEGVMVLKTGNRHPATDTVKLFNIFPYQTKADTCFYTTGISYYDMLTMVDVTMRFEYRLNDSLLNIPEQNSLFNDMSLRNYRQLLDGNRKISERINTGQLDSVLSSLLKEAGIEQPYIFGLKKKTQDSFEYVSGGTAQDRKSLLASTFHMPLFNSTPLADTYDIYFLLFDTSVIIGRSLMWSLAASVAIVILLAGSFLYFMRTVLRQRKLSEMKNDFINNMTHEFMTPVTNIALALETIRNGNLEANTTTRILDIIDTENGHLKNNINKVLQIAVIEKGGLMLNLNLVDIHEVLKKLTRSFEMAIAAKKGKFTLDLKATEHLITADETHIINMLGNVIDNAIKYTPDNPEIVISTAVTNKKLVVSIADNGPGISIDIQKRMFEKFYRGQHQNVHDVKGFGLGLSYVKSIAEAHHISLQVKSAAATGTTFLFLFNIRNGK